MRFNDITIMSDISSKDSKEFTNADDALTYLKELYTQQTEHLRNAFVDFTTNDKARSRIRGYYPYVRLQTKYANRSDTRLAYGFVPKPGKYSITLTRPDIFGGYYKKQLDLLMKNHEVPVEVGLSETPIPIHFALGENFHLEQDLDDRKAEHVPNIFDVPDLNIMDDEIANATYQPGHDNELPLALFTAPRVDLSLQRLKHYCGSSPEHFQNYVIFTNYQFYIDEFVQMCEEMMELTDDAGLKKERMAYESFVGPGDYVLPNQNAEGAGELEERSPLKRMPQMPAYHLKRADGSGITMINIGVGPSNAKTITDHVAVLRPHAWLMLGHCAGLRNSQHLGDYVLAHGYLREDNILDDDLPPSIPIPALAEIQQALEEAVSTVTGYKGYDLKKFMRTGTVATTDDRNWELRSSFRQNLRLSQSRAIAMDMESGTIAANGFRFRVPYGTLLCVSDKPLHGQLKLPGMAHSFYRERVEQHLKIGLLTMTLLRDYSPERLHSRKLRSFNEVAFQ